MMAWARLVQDCHSQISFTQRPRSGWGLRSILLRIHGCERSFCGDGLDFGSLSRL